MAATALPSTVKCTTALASPVPVSAGLEVILSIDEAPVSLDRFSVIEGGVASVKESDAVPALPAASVSLATMGCAPTARPVGVYDQAPIESAIAVAAIALPSTGK